MADKETSLQELIKGGGELSTYLQDPLEKPFLTMELGGYLPQLNIASALGARHIVSPPIADLADALTDPISAALFGLGEKAFTLGVKGVSGAVRTGVRGSIKAATSGEKVAYEMADRFARRAGKALETQSWEAIRPVVDEGIAAGKSPTKIIGELTDIKKDIPRWKSSSGAQMTPSARNIDHIISAIHGAKPGKIRAFLGAKEIKGTPEAALAFIDEQIALRKTLHQEVIKAGQAGDVPAFLRGLDEVFKIEPSARMGILREGAKKQVKLAEQGLAKTPAAEFARMHPKIATFTPFKKAGLVPGGEAGAEAVARAQKWPIQQQGFETVIHGFAKLGQAVKGAPAPPDGAAATDIATVHMGDIQWGDVSTQVVMRDFSKKFDASARARIGTMIMDPAQAFEGVTKDTARAVDFVENAKFHGMEVGAVTPGEEMVPVHHYMTETGPKQLLEGGVDPNKIVTTEYFEQTGGLAEVPNTLYHITEKKFVAGELKPGKDNIIWFTANQHDPEILEKASRAGTIPNIIPAKVEINRILEVPTEMLEAGYAKNVEGIPGLISPADPTRFISKKTLEQWANAGFDAVMHEEGNPEHFGYIGHLRTKAAQPASRTATGYKTAAGEALGSFMGLVPKATFGTSEAEILVAEQLKATLQDVGQYLVDEDIIRGMLDNYFPRVIKNYGKVLLDKDKLSLVERLKEAITKEAAQGTGKGLSGFTRHGLPRTMAYDDLLQMEKGGILEVEKDPAKILNEYFRSTNKAAADKRALDRFAFNAYPVEAAIPESAAADFVTGKTGGPPKVGAIVYTRSDPPPKSISHLYELGSDPALLNIARTKYGQVGDKVWVLKEAHAPIRRAFGAGLYQGPAQSVSEHALRAMLTLNSFAKRASMFMSAFHFVNLTESMVMDMGAAFFNPRAFRRATKSLYNASDMMELAVRSGMTVGPIVDAEWNTFSKAMVAAADWLKSKRIPLVSGKIGLEGVARAWNAVDGAFNRAMWDYYQNSAKMMAFSEMYYDGLRRFPNMKPNQIAESVSKHVNNAIGGINWERMWISRQGQQWARLLMFAPDYTMTNLMLAADVFAAKFVKAPGQRIPFKVLFEDSPQAYYARQFAFRARTIPAFMANHLNYAFTSWRDGQGHWLHENDKGNTDRIEMPWLDDKGKKQYYRFGNQMREPVELVRLWDEYDGPWKFLHKKIGTIPQFFVTNFSGTDAVGRPIFTTKDGWVQKLGEELGYTQGQTRWIQEISDRSKVALEMGGTPIWLRQALNAGQQPTSSTMLNLLGIPVYGGRKPRKEKGARQASFGVR